MLSQLYHFIANAPVAYTWLLDLLVSFGLWRLYNFVLLPFLRPNEPKPLPYWIPLLGHVVSFINNQERFLLDAKKAMGGSDTPFAITLGGRKVYVINDPNDVGHIYRSTTALSFEGFLRIIIADFGMAGSGIDKLFQKRPNPQSKHETSVADIFHKMQVKQGQGKDLKDFEVHVDAFFQRNLFLDAMMKEKSCQPSFLAPNIENDRAVTLKGWTREVFINCTQALYFGESLAKLNPRLPQILTEFDDLSWQVFYGVPKVFRSRLTHVGNELLETFKLYLQIPQSSRGCKAWFMNALEDEYRAAGLTDSDIASQFLFLYWGITTNASKVIFWILVHLLYDPSLLSSIRDKTKHACFSSSASPQDDSNKNHDIFRDSCPHLDSLWNEVLRTTAAATAVRTVEQDIHVGGTLLRKGATTLSSARLLHYREDAFGSNVKEFDSQRFSKDPHLRRSPAFRPFGGGVTHCPGRFLARYMGFSFVSLTLEKYDFKLAMPQARLLPSQAKPAVGIMDADRDLLVRFTDKALKG